MPENIARHETLGWAIAFGEGNWEVSMPCSLERGPHLVVVGVYSWLLLRSHLQITEIMLQTKR